MPQSSESTVRSLAVHDRDAARVAVARGDRCRRCSGRRREADLADPADRPAAASFPDRELEPHHTRLHADDRELLAVLAPLGGVQCRADLARRAAHGEDAREVPRRSNDVTNSVRSSTAISFVGDRLSRCVREPERARLDCRCATRTLRAVCLPARAGRRPVAVGREARRPDGAAAEGDALVRDARRRRRRCHPAARGAPDARTENVSSANARSRADSKRSPGSFSVQAAGSSRASGLRRSSSGSVGRSSPRIAAMDSAGLSRRNGALPASISCSRSRARRGPARWSAATPQTCSGAM